MMTKYVVTGGSSGLGRAIVEAIHGPNSMVFNVSREMPHSELARERFILGDVRSWSDMQQVASLVGEMDVLINCAGVNRIARFEDLHWDDWSECMDTNAQGIVNTAQAFLTALKRSRGTILNIISNASHIPMTHSAAYNASKAAAHMLTLQMARELTSQNLTVFGISPAKIEGTGMSKYIEGRVPHMRGWTLQQAAEYQRKALVTGKEINVEVLAEFIAWILAYKSRHYWFSGCVIPYGA